MLDENDYTAKNVKSLTFSYFQGEEITYVFSGDHEESHYYDENYENEIPPVVRINDGFGIIGNDGNHRCNTCINHDLPLPVVMINLN